MTLITFITHLPVPSDVHFRISEEVLGSFQPGLIGNMYFGTEMVVNFRVV